MSKELNDGRFQVTAEDGRKLTFDNQGNSLDKRGPEYSWHRFDFPLQVGKDWKYQRKIGGQLWNGTETAKWRVIAYESISVPAGTFDCFRVEGEVWANWMDATSLIQSPNQSHTYTTYWYCRAVGWIAKIKQRQQVYLGRPYVESFQS